MAYAEKKRKQWLRVLFYHNYNSTLSQCKSFLAKSLEVAMTDPVYSVLQDQK